MVITRMHVELTHHNLGDIACLASTESPLANLNVVPKNVTLTMCPSQMPAHLVPGKCTMETYCFLMSQTGTAVVLNFPEVPPPPTHEFLRVD